MVEVMIVREPNRQYPGYHFRQHWLDSRLLAIPLICLLSVPAISVSVPAISQHNTPSLA
jgi:hypothetical protein